MRLKLIVLAIGAAIAVYALMFGSQALSKLSKYRTSTTISQSEEPADVGPTREIPTIVNTGIGGINKSLSGMKDNVQNTVDERQERLDEQIEIAK